MVHPIRLDFSPAQPRTNVTVEYAAQVAERLRHSPDRHILVRYLPNHLVYLKKETSRRYVVTIASIPALDPPLQSVVGQQRPWCTLAG
ncbi:MAG TPA: hypothetical protein VFV38_39735 [Ktedonobacteraceae bacterium]|nr:hypothetical protein [Ktedonobacteraceae bacterium]